MKLLSLFSKAVFGSLGIGVAGFALMDAQAAAFTYQGRLADGNGPAAGLFSLQFALFDSPTNGNQLGDTVTVTNSAIANGLFTATLEFGNGVFTGQDRWLQI